MIYKRFVLWTVGLAILGSAGTAQAQQSFKKVAELRIYHFTKQEVQVIDSAGNRRDLARLESEMHFGVPMDTRVKIVVQDPNPLLYSYSWHGVTATPTDNYKTIEQLATALNAFARQVETTKDANHKETIDAALKTLNEKQVTLAAASALAAKAKSDLEAYRRGVKLNSLSDPQMQRLAQLEGSAREAQSNEKARNVEARTAELKLSLARLIQERHEAIVAAGITEERLSSLGAALKDLSEMASKVPDIIAESTTDSAAAKETAALHLHDLNALSSKIAELYSTLEAAGSAVIRGIAPLDGPGDALIETLTLALHYELETKSTISKLKEFRAAAGAINVPIVVGEVDFSPLEVQAARFSIDLLDGASDPLRPSRGTGEFHAAIEPLSPVVYSFAAGYVYTWLRKVPGVSNQQAAGLLSITPRKLIWSDLALSINLGVTGNPDGPGFMLGGSANLARGIQVGIGVVYRDVGTDARDYRPGGYLLLGVDFGKKKK